MSESLYTTQTPVTESDDGGNQRQLGLRFTVSADGRVTGGRYWVPASGLPTIARWQLWLDSDSSRLADVDMHTIGPVTDGAWADFPLDTAIDAVTTDVFEVVSYTLGGDFSVTDDGTDVFPLVNGHLTADTGVFMNGGAATDFPTGRFDAYFFADVIFEAGPEQSTVVLTAAVMSLTALAVDPIPGAVAVTLTPAVFALVAPAVDPVPQLVTVALVPAIVAFAAVPLGPTAGQVTVTLVPAILTLAAIALGVGGPAPAGRGAVTLRDTGTVNVVNRSGVVLR